MSANKALMCRAIVGWRAHPCTTPKRKANKVQELRWPSGSSGSVGDISTEYYANLGKAGNYVLGQSICEGQLLRNALADLKVRAP